MTKDHDWITFHRVQFTEEIDGAGSPLPGPDGAQIWRFAPSSKINEDGLWSNHGDIWGGFALYSSEAEARAVFDDPHAHLPYMDRATSSWHALVVPYAHRGGVHWRDEVEEDSAIRVAPADPKGPLLVFTSAGYDNPGPDDLPRIKAFISGIVDVVDYYRTLPGNLRADVFAGAGIDGRDGCTLTLWQDDKSMMTSAYKTGVHNEQMERHQAETLFDRSSFSRGRVVASKGDWDGTDPISELAQRA